MKINHYPFRVDWVKTIFIKVYIIIKEVIFFLKLGLTVLKKANQVNKICSDGQNIKLLSIFKKNIESGTYIKRENIKRRIPGLINYILNCS